MIKTWKERQEFVMKCKQCNKSCETKSFNKRFCSNACKSAWRRDSERDSVERKCPVCENAFNVNKYSKNKTCGRKCGFVLASQCS